MQKAAVNYPPYGLPSVTAARFLVPRREQGSGCLKLPPLRCPLSTAFSETPFKYLQLYVTNNTCRLLLRLVREDELSLGDAHFIQLFIVGRSIICNSTNVGVNYALTMEYKQDEWKLCDADSPYLKR
jgi:hypothetical protein